MIKKIAVAFIVLALSAGVAGCTVSQASTEDQYGRYLSELNSGNADFGLARAQYDQASQAFSGGIDYDAIDAMATACDDYDQAMEHYAHMAGYANGPDQRDYAAALQSYAQSCMYVASAYLAAYKASDRGDRLKMDASFAEAAAFVAQANEYHDKAVKLQPMAIV